MNLFFDCWVNNDNVCFGPYNKIFFAEVKYSIGVGKHQFVDTLRF